MPLQRTFIGGDGVRRPARLGKELNHGGAAGSIRANPADASSLIKLYHTSEIARAHEDKIWAMLERPPNLPPIQKDGNLYVQLSWPSAALVDNAGRVLGFAMPLIDFDKSVALESLLQRVSRKLDKLPEQLSFRLTVARNLSAVFAELHALGHYVIDAKPVNIRVYRASAVMAILDCDGFHITGEDGRRYPAKHFSEGYIAPEGKNQRPEDLGVNQDNFALAVMIFQLLNNGLHPFQGSLKLGARLNSDDLQTRINAYSFPYGFEADRYQLCSPISVHEFLPDATRTLFGQAFRETSRPAALTWRRHLDDLIKAARPCAKQPALHLDFGKGCGLCALDAKLARYRIAARAAPNPNRPPIQIVAPTLAANIPQTINPATTYQLPVQPNNKKWAWGVIIGLALIWVLASLGGNNQNRTTATTNVAPPVTVPGGASPQIALAQPQLGPKPDVQASPQITAPPAQTTPTEKITPYHAELVATRAVNLRERPSETARILGTVERGTLLVSTFRIDDGWLAVQWQNATAYIAERYTSSPDAWRKANTLRGQVQSLRGVTTLVIAGREIHLADIAPLPGDYDQRLLNWLDLRGGIIECEPLPAAKYRCYTAKNIDIALGAILNGFGSAITGAPAEYTSSEEQAREARRGYWMNAASR